LLVPCATVSDAIIEALCDTPEPDKLDLIRAGGGRAAIFGPDGSLLTPTVADTNDGLLYAELDLGVISIAKSVADPPGHYSRPDVTRLLLNRTPSKRVDIAAPLETITSLKASLRRSNPNCAPHDAVERCAVAIYS
jgi:nitrilase